MTKHDILEIAIKHCSDYSDGDFTFNDEELLWFINDLSTTDRLAGLNERDEWRDAERDKPERIGTYICLFKDEFVFTASLNVLGYWTITGGSFYGDTKLGGYEYGQPSHWMPLPSLPQPPNK